MKKTITFSFFPLCFIVKRAELVRLKLQASHSYHHWLNDLRTAPQHFPRIPTVCTEPQFLDLIGTKVLRVSSLLFTVASTHGYYSPLEQKWVETGFLYKHCIQKPQVWELSRLWPETSTKSYVREFSSSTPRNKPLGVKLCYSSIIYWDVKLFFMGLTLAVPFSWSYVVKYSKQVEIRNFREYERKISVQCKYWWL